MGVRERVSVREEGKGRRQGGGSEWQRREVGWNKRDEKRISGGWEDRRGRAEWEEEEHGEEKGKNMSAGKEE